MAVADKWSIVCIDLPLVIIRPSSSSEIATMRGTEDQGMSLVLETLEKLGC